MSLLNNAKWNFFSQAFKILAQLINVVYLAKIIPPAEYGIMAMAMVVINLGTLLRDLGTSAAIIQRKELTPNLVNTVFWLNVIMGVGLCIIVLGSSSFIASLYHQDKLFYVLVILSVVFPLSSCAAVSSCTSGKGVSIQENLHYRSFIIYSFCDRRYCIGESWIWCI